MTSNSQNKAVQNNTWSVERAREFYSINVWSEGYFDVNELGHMVAKPNEHTNIDLIEVSRQLEQQGLSLPVLVRFPQILQTRIHEIDAAFRQAAAKHKCQLKHIACYPIKVNQQRTVIEQILASDSKNIGLEVGSKTELLVALGLLGSCQLRLVCNGYKDRAYIRIALYAQAMGIDVFIVIESPSELAIIKKECTRLNITPKLGLRVKLNSVAEGNWQNSGGKDAKFGLDAKDILYCLEMLTQWKCESWLCLIHFHMGSQISKLKDFAMGLQEAMFVFGEIAARGFGLQYLDVGGGLAIDYASQHDASYFSRSYTIQEYADTIVNTIVQYCQQHSIQIPVVLTENGRAITAHHALLITNVVKVREHEEPKCEASRPQQGSDELFVLGEKLQTLVRRRDKDINTHRTLFESKLQEKFLQGEVNLQQRAWAENILQKSEANEELLDENLLHISSSVTEKYYCNFSIFQSMPDVWGLNQIFPVVPLNRLAERPTKETCLHDLTCDSDGKIGQYAYNNFIHDYITLHELSSHEEYLLGFFLLGAYQEVLGDMHNLFGDTHAVNVVQDDQGQMQFTEIEIGDCVDELLVSIHLDGDRIIQSCRDRLSQADMTNVTSEEMLEEINNALYGYTYLDSIDRPVHRIKR